MFTLSFLTSRFSRIISISRMEVDDVVDLSVGPDKEPTAPLSMNEKTARDFRALTQNTNLTITPAAMPSGSSENTSSGMFLNLLCNSIMFKIIV